MASVELFTDGACLGNPGAGGWAVLLRSGEHSKTLSGYELDTTNNRMELQAVIEGLKVIKRPSEVHITTDSQYVSKGMTEWIGNWRKRRWRNSKNQPVKNADLWQELDGLVQNHDVHWHWVKGHSGHPENELVDTLARDAIPSNPRR